MTRSLSWAERPKGEKYAQSQRSTQKTNCGLHVTSKIWNCNIFCFRFVGWFSFPVVLIKTFAETMTKRKVKNVEVSLNGKCFWWNHREKKKRCFSHIIGIAGSRWLPLPVREIFAKGHPTHVLATHSVLFYKYRLSFGAPSGDKAPIISAKQLLNPSDSVQNNCTKYTEFDAISDEYGCIKWNRYCFFSYRIYHSHGSLMAVNGPLTAFYSGWAECRLVDWRITCFTHLPNIDCCSFNWLWALCSVLWLLITSFRPSGC